MNTFIKNSWHYIMGLAVVGSMSGLAATGTITGTQALTIIGGVSLTLIGGTLGAMSPSTNKAATTSPKGSS